MNNNFEYYYNNVPGKGLCRNNLVYTSLISKDKKTFCKWFYNDKTYHKNQNEIVDQELMEEKWRREVRFLSKMFKQYPEHVLEILDIDYKNKKIYLKIENVDFWELSNCSKDNYSKALKDWDSQMLEIIQAHKSLGIYKYSMHPSSYFIVNKKLKSINYFFAYDKAEKFISIKDVESHIYSARQDKLKKYVEAQGISWDKPQSFDILNILCWNSFKDNYDQKFIKKVLECLK